MTHTRQIRRHRGIDEKVELRRKIESSLVTLCANNSAEDSPEDSPAIKEVAVCEHLCHIDNVICSDINCPTVMFKHIKSLSNILFTDLQVMFVEEKQRSPNVPVVCDGIE